MHKEGWSWDGWEGDSKQWEKEMFKKLVTERWKGGGGRWGHTNNPLMHLRLNDIALPYSKFVFCVTYSLLQK